MQWHKFSRFGRPGRNGFTTLIDPRTEGEKNTLAAWVQFINRNSVNVREKEDTTDRQADVQAPDRCFMARQPQQVNEQTAIITRTRVQKQ